jgi:hypothetical protein
VQSGNLFDPSAGAGNRLYRNRGNGTFEDVTEGSGAGVRGYGMGVAAGDFDNDGYTDLYVTNFGQNILLKNDGHGHFTDVTAKAGVASSGWSTSAAFLDYDGDGALDLFVAHYLNWRRSAEVECFSLTGVPDYCSPASYDLPSAATLYHNNGDGTFSDVSARSGVSAAVGNGLGVVAGDFNGDGRIDVMVANDRTPNHLWLNQGGGRLREAALTHGCAVDQTGWRSRALASTPMSMTTATSIARGQSRRRVGLVLRNQGKFFVGAGVGQARRAVRSRGSAWRFAISTTTIPRPTKRTAVGRQSDFITGSGSGTHLSFGGWQGRVSREVAPRVGRIDAHRPAGRPLATSTTTVESMSWS